MPVEEPPGWLPDGWFMKVKKKKSGKVQRYYLSPVSGRVFCSKVEVLHFLNIENVTSQAIELVCSEYDEHIAEQSEDSPLWLPTGWILEIRGLKSGKKYKCYFDPSTRSRFYSKAEVVRHLKDRKSCDSMPKHKRCMDRILRDNVLAQIEISPDGLPSGWIKEMKFRRNASGIRKDAYYTDLMSGLIFRTRKDVDRYIETGEISKYATRPKKRSSIGMLLSPTAARKMKWRETTGRRRQFLFSGQTPNSGGRIGQEIGGSYEEKPGLPLSYNESPICVKDEYPELLTLSDEAKPVETLRISGVIPDDPSDLVEDNWLKQDEKKPSEPADEEMLKLRDNKIPDSPNCKSFGHEDTNDKIERLLDLVYDGLPESSSDESPKSAYRKIAYEELPDYKKPFEEAEINLLVDKLSKPANEKEVEPKEKLAELVNERLPEASCGKLDEGAKEHASGSKLLGGTKAKAVKVKTLPLRASKRLAGLEADTSAAIIIDTPSRKKRKLSAPSKAKSSDVALSKKADNSEALHVQDQGTSGNLIKDTAVDQTDSKEKPEAGNTTNNKTELALPFGDSWPDPCIEFAFKTLTGDIPLFEDTTVVQDYFKLQLATAQTWSHHGCSAESSSTGSTNGSNRLDFQTQFKPTGNRPLPTENDRFPCSSNGELQPGTNAIDETEKEKIEPLTIPFR